MKKFFVFIIFSGLFFLSTNNSSALRKMDLSVASLFALNPYVELERHEGGSFIYMLETSYGLVKYYELFRADNDLLLVYPNKMPTRDIPGMEKYCQWAFFGARGGWLYCLIDCSSVTGKIVPIAILPEAEESGEYLMLTADKVLRGILLELFEWIP